MAQRKNELDHTYYFDKKYELTTCTNEVRTALLEMCAEAEKIPGINVDHWVRHAPLALPAPRPVALPSLRHAHCALRAGGTAIFLVDAVTLLVPARSRGRGTLSI